MSAMTSPNDTAVQFELTGPSQGYISIGFSDDQRMVNVAFHPSLLKPLENYTKGVNVSFVVEVIGLFLHLNVQLNVCLCSLCFCVLLRVMYFSSSPKGNDDIYICGRDSNGFIQLQHAFSTGRRAPEILPLVHAIPSHNLAC